MGILTPVAGRDLEQGKRKWVVTVGLWWAETQDKAFLLVFHDVVYPTSLSHTLSTVCYICSILELLTAVL